MLENFCFAYAVQPEIVQGKTSADKMDGCYAWVVCFAVFVIEFIVMGFFTAFGTLFVVLIKEFKATESSAAWVGSVAFATCYLSSFLVNILLPHLGYRLLCCLGSILFATGLIASSFANSVLVLFVTYGIIFGCGCGFVHFSGVLVIPKFFKYKRGIAYGVSFSGHGIGAWPMGYLLEYLATKYDLRTTLLLSAFLALPLFIGGLTFGSASVQSKCCKKSRFEIEVKKHEKRQSVWRNKALLANCIALWMYGFGYYIPSVHLVNMAEGLGVPLVKATLLPSSIAISQSVGKIAFGQLAVCFRQINAVHFCQVTMFICGIITTFCPLMTDFTGLLFYATTYGFFDACSSVYTLKIIEEIVGEANIDAGYAVQMAGMSFFMLIGPPTAGFLYESTGTYEIPFFLSGAFMTTCVCIMFLVPCFKEKHSLPDELIAVIERKVSVISSSSIDSGISVQRDNVTEQQRRESWPLEDSKLSDYETDDENSENHASDCERNDKRMILEGSKLSLFRMMDFKSICYGSQFALHIKRDNLLVERETMV